MAKTVAVGTLPVICSKTLRDMDERAMETLELNQGLESPVKGVEVTGEAPLRNLLPS